LLEDFAAWARASGGWRGNPEDQAKGSLGLFLEICGDKPIERYTRADADTFRSALRKLPSTYRKSARDREKPITQIIAEAASRNAPRLAEKRAKRHFWALSRFCAFLIETGRLPRDADNFGRGFTFNTKGPARKLRDRWTGEAGVSEAFVDLLTGHESGGESRRRYLKGISLPQLRAAMERVQWPEVDLSGLYLRAAGDEHWPVKEAPAAA
jgi:hypothetical protein